jgi:hypothetical protein
MAIVWRSFRAAATALATDELRKEVERAVIRGETLTKTAANPPVDTGRLRADIQHAMDPVRPEGWFGNTVHYSVYVNLGTRKMRANPYLLRGLDLLQAEIIRRGGR